MASKVILVTGASSGIGAAIAERLVAEGHRVFGTSRQGTVASKGVEAVALDVGSDDSVRACVDAVIAKAGRVDVLVNNAGYLLAGAIEEATVEQAKAVFETNVFGLARMVKAVLPGMRAQQSGLIVNMNSLAGMVPLPFWGYYNASKFAVEGLSETLRFELEPLGVRVAMIEPGAIKTPFYAQPQATPMAAYEPWRTRFLTTMRELEEKAPGPDAVAKVVSRVVAARRPRLRNRVTREAMIFPFLRWLLPARAFELGLRQGFNLDRQTAALPPAAEAAKPS